MKATDALIDGHDVARKDSTMDGTADPGGDFSTPAVVLNTPSSAADHGGSTSTVNASQPHATSDSQHQHVDHTYKDYANVDPDDILVNGLAEAEDEATKDLFCYGVGRTKRRLRGSAHLSFPVKLLEVLDRSDLRTM